MELILRVYNAVYNCFQNIKKCFQNVKKCFQNRPSFQNVKKCFQNITPTWGKMVFLEYYMIYTLYYGSFQNNVFYSKTLKNASKTSNSHSFTTLYSSKTLKNHSKMHNPSLNPTHKKLKLKTRILSISSKPPTQLKQS